MCFSCSTISLKIHIYNAATTKNHQPSQNNTVGPTHGFFDIHKLHKKTDQDLFRKISFTCFDTRVKICTQVDL